MILDFGLFALLMCKIQTQPSVKVSSVDASPSVNIRRRVIYPMGAGLLCLAECNFYWFNIGFDGLSYVIFLVIDFLEPHSFVLFIDLARFPKYSFLLSSKWLCTTSCYTPKLITRCTFSNFKAKNSQMWTWSTFTSRSGMFKVCGIRNSK